MNAYLINFNTMPLEQYLKGITYFLEIVVNEMLVPGRIENWVILIDLDYKGIMGLAINVIIYIYLYL